MTQRTVYVRQQNIAKNRAALAADKLADLAPVFVVDDETGEGQHEFTLMAGMLLRVRGEVAGTFVYDPLAPEGQPSAYLALAEGVEIVDPGAVLPASRGHNRQRNGTGPRRSCCGPKKGKKK